jgi:hypothetical protein
MHHCSGRGDRQRAHLHRHPDAAILVLTKVGVAIILPSADALGTVGLKAPITVRDLHSEVRRDWKQLICRKLAHSTAVKTGLGECPKKRGPPKIRTKTEHQYKTL